MLRIVTWKWYDPKYRWNPYYLYTAHHVNRLYRAVRDNLSLPHEFICLTDDPEGIDSGVRVLPVPTRHAELGGCYRRLWLFSDEARQVIGERIVQIDLDSMVTGDLTPLFDRDDSFVCWCHGYADRRNRSVYCASLLMMTAGVYEAVWETFDPHKSPEIVKDIVGTDQAWFTHVLGPDMPTWGRKDGVYSFRRHFNRGGLDGRNVRLGRMREPPPDCRAIFFHGQFDPSLPEIRSTFPWIDHYWSQ